MPRIEKFFGSFAWNTVFFMVDANSENCNSKIEKKDLEKTASNLPHEEFCLV